MTQPMPYLPTDEYKKAMFRVRNRIVMCFDFLEVRGKIPKRYWFGLTPEVEEAVEELCRA